MNPYRRKCREVLLGGIAIGGSHDITIQSMTNIPTNQVADNVQQISSLVASGCDIVRLSVSSRKDVGCLREIKTSCTKRGLMVPIVADVHFSPELALDCLEVADKVRINPGNFSDKLLSNQRFSEEKFSIGKQELSKKLEKFFFRAKFLGKPVRIGINRGSLAPRIVYRFGNGDLAMWESAKECLEVASTVGFYEIILSFKSSDANGMINCNQLACAEMDRLGYQFPIHLGVTEAGAAGYGKIKSAVGIGTLLNLGIGDTIRVSLTDDPINEIAVAKDILQACGRRRFYTEIVSCPACGRTRYNIQDVAKKVREKINNFDKNLKIAVMGCAINGLGEAGDADFAILGNPNGTLSIYKKTECIKPGIPEDDILRELINCVNCG